MFHMIYITVVLPYTTIEQQLPLPPLYSFLPLYTEQMFDYN